MGEVTFRLEQSKRRKSLEDIYIYIYLLELIAVLVVAGVDFSHSREKFQDESGNN